MAGPTDTRVAHWLLDDLISTITTYANDSSATMVGIIGPVAASLLTIYVMLWGAGIASGQISEPFTDGAKRIIRMCAIIAFALTAGIYQGTVADFFLTAPTAIATEIAAPGSTSTADPASIADVLDESLGRGIEIGNKMWEKGDEGNTLLPPSMSGIGFYLLAIITYIGVVVVVAIAAAIVFVAYVALALLLAVGPLFIMMAIFQQTQRYFEAWIGQVVNYAILFILVAVCVGLTFTMLESMLTLLVGVSWQESIISALKVLAAAIAIVTVLLQTRSIASGLGGGVALSAQNLAGKLAGGTASFARAAMTGHSGRGVYAGASQQISGQRALGAAGRSAAGSSAGQAVKAGYGRVRRRFSGNSVSGG
jgi:type IV secretion system protein VirB6